MFSLKKSLQINPESQQNFPSPQPQQDYSDSWLKKLWLAQRPECGTRQGAWQGQQRQQLKAQRELEQLKAIAAAPGL